MDITTAPLEPAVQETAAIPDSAPLSPESESAGPTAAAEPEGEEIQRAQYMPLSESPAGNPLGNIDYLKDVNLEAAVELGNTHLSLERILGLGVGSILELNQSVGEPVRLLINNNIYAWGEVVVIGDRFGIRISKISHV